jgi:ABC-type spermidine/putrescine transport system permease subunit II
MIRREPIGWYVGLVLVIVVPIVIAVVLLWNASGQQILVNEFYTSQNEQITDEEYRYWDAIQRSSYLSATVTAPTLITTGVAALFGLLAVLALRWERRPGAAQEPAEATAS